MTKRTLMMRELMVVASLVVAGGCGAVLPPESDENRMADGSDDPTATLLTIDPAGFIDDGERWWTNTSGPTLSGTYEGEAKAAIDVSVGSIVVAAQADGGRWSATLPIGSITATDAVAAVTMQTEHGAPIVREQLLALDIAAPRVAIAPSIVRDERGDVITFSAAGPLHDHKGTAVDLAADGCPTIAKYAYLMGEQQPEYGDEVAPNPFTWQFTVAEAQVELAEFRIVRADSTVARDWTAIPTTASSLAIPMLRDGALGLEELGTRAGEYTIEVRVRDWSGLETVVSRCWINAPLAAPLAFMQAMIPTDADALAGWSLSANSPVSRLTNGAGAAVAEQRFVQYSSEPVSFAVETAPISGQWSIDWLQGFVATAHTYTRTPCGADGSGCYGVTAPTRTTYAASPLTSFTTTVEVLEPNGDVVRPREGNLVIPGRGVGEAPVEYRVRVSLSNITHYGSDAAFVYGEHEDGSVAYTGTVASQRTTACARVDSTGLNCTVRASYAYLRGVDRITLALSPLTIRFAVAAATTTPYAAPAHVPAAAFVTPELSWTGGDENSL